MEAGDFSSLAEAYSRYRPDYSTVVLRNLLSVIKPQNVLDVGAGTGIWTKMLAEQGLAVTAVEPNDPMRKEGQLYTGETSIVWNKGSAENTGMASASFDWVTMASSFHWADLTTALREFSRVLKPNGWLTVLWNPRDIETSELHQEIEKILYEIVPDLKRVSSGNTKHARNYMTELVSTNEFKEVFFMEAPHQIKMNLDRYIGAWRSVNDVQQQAGPERFERFLERVTKLLSGQSEIVVPYKTRSWTAQRVK